MKTPAQKVQDSLKRFNPDDAGKNPKKSKPKVEKPAEKGFPFASEMHLSEAFTAKAQGFLRWTPGLDWMANCGTHWERDELRLRDGVAKTVSDETAAVLDNDKVKTKICSLSTANAMVTLARGNPGIVTPIDEWDQHQLILNTPGDAIDLTTGRPIFRGEMLFTQVSSIAPLAMATPMWDKFIFEVFDGDDAMIDFIQRMGGYALTGSTKEQKLFFLHGVGSNGKSVFLDVLRDIAGKYAHNFPSSALMTSQHEGHLQRFAALHGKRLAISSEIEESAHWAESRIKELTGDKTMTANYMRQNDFTFDITHKHIIAGNFKPRLKGDDFAMVRRLVLVPFNQKFEGARRDNDLPEKLKAEYPGILTWFIEGARKWVATGLAIPESVTTASREYMAEQNDLGLWLSECCTQKNGATASRAQAYASFSIWKEKQGEHAPSNKSFTQRLERIFTPTRTSTVRGYDGFEVKFVSDFPGNYMDESRGR